MNTRRSIINLVSKLTFFSYLIPGTASFLVPSTTKNYISPIHDVYVDLANLENSQYHFKLKPGEKIKINLIINQNNSINEKTKTVVFQMPLISLRPYVFSYPNKQKFDLPFLVFSAKGTPLKEA